MPAPLTTHARVRMQQRGISPAVLDVLLAYGREIHDHRGCRIVRFDKRSRRRAARELGSLLPRFERHFGAYAVIGPDDAVVTVGHRHPGRRNRGNGPGSNFQ